MNIGKEKPTTPQKQTAGKKQGKKTTLKQLRKPDSPEEQRHNQIGKDRRRNNRRIGSSQVKRQLRRAIQRREKGRTENNSISKTGRATSAAAEETEEEAMGTCGNSGRSQTRQKKRR